MIGALLFSTVGFSVSRHYCMGDLVDESFYHIPQECGLDNDDHCGGDDEHFSKNCCEDENLVFEGIDVLTTQQDHFNPIAAAILTSPYAIVGSVEKHISKNTFPNAPPPPAESGRQILIRVQRFLI